MTLRLILLLLFTLSTVFSPRLALACASVDFKKCVHTGQEKEQTTYATIGLGNITVGGNTDPDLDGLNRDVNNAQVITKDMITGALDGSVTVDNRLFTYDGRASIAKDFKNFGSNIKQMGKGLRNNIVTKSIENAYTDDKKDIIDTVKDYIELDRQQAELQKKKEDLVEKLNGMTNLDAPASRDALQELVDLASQGGGFEGKLNLASVDGNVIGVAYQSADGTEKTITLNLKNVNLADPNALMNAVYHETTNFDDHRANEQTATNRGDIDSALPDVTYSYEIRGGGSHIVDRALERKVTYEAIIDTLENPVIKEPIKIDATGQSSQRIIGNDATVVVNPETGNWITVWGAGSKTKK